MKNILKESNIIYSDKLIEHIVFKSKSAIELMGSINRIETYKTINNDFKLDDDKCIEILKEFFNE